MSAEITQSSLTAPLHTKTNLACYWTTIAYAFYMDKTPKSCVSAQLAKAIADSNVSLYNRQVDDLQLLAKGFNFQYQGLVRLNREIKRPLIFSALLLTIMAGGETGIAFLNCMHALWKGDKAQCERALERLKSASFTIFWSMAVSVMSGICGVYVTPSESTARRIASRLIPRIWPSCPVRGSDFSRLDPDSKFY